MALAKSKDVINYLKKKLNKNNFASLFICGSVPELLGPGKDLDLFVVTKTGREFNALNDLDKSMKKLINKYDKLTYRFLTGPMKYKHKGLIHILTYTEKPLKKHEKIHFEKEHQSVLVNLLKAKIILMGKHPKSLINNFPTKKEIDKDKKRVKKNYTQLTKEGLVSKRQWVKTKDGWKRKKITMRPSKFLREEMLKYYKKWV